jgi:exodeoxyribonuclease VII large subunit
MEQISLDWGRRHVRSVSQLTGEIRGLLTDSFDDIWVAGEISQVKPAASGHMYFTLKDADSQIRAVCFKSSLRFLRFKPREGVAVLARGRIDVYEPRGEYQLLVEAMEPQGLGALQLAFDQLKRRLEEAGLFDAARKRALPRFPRRIGVVTSPDGAAVRDIVEILSRRFPGIHIRLYPAQVQGAGSVEAVVEGLRHFGRGGWADLVIVGRGGGSLEDLWTFNEEPVARAIAASAVPVISAVGHETDFTIADFVADLRAPTPSAAAELAVPNRADTEDRLAAASARATRALLFRISRARGLVHQLGVERANALLQRRIGRLGQRVDDLDSRARQVVARRLADLRRRWQALDARLHKQDLRVRLADARTRLGSLDASLVVAMAARLDLYRRRRDRADAALAHLSPLRVLERGYAIAQDERGHVLTDPSEVAPGELIGVRLHQGRLRARVVS